MKEADVSGRDRGVSFDCQWTGNTAAEQLGVAARADRVVMPNEGYGKRARQTR